MSAISFELDTGHSVFDDMFKYEVLFCYGLTAKSMLYGHAYIFFKTICIKGES